MTFERFTQEEIFELIRDIRLSYDGLAAKVEKNLRAGSDWDDETASELIHNVSAAAESIRNEQTDYLLTSPYGALDIELTDVLNTYSETVAALGGVIR